MTVVSDRNEDIVTLLSSYKGVGASGSINVKRGR